MRTNAIIIKSRFIKIHILYKPYIVYDSHHCYQWTCHHMIRDAHPRLCTEDLTNNNGQKRAQTAHSGAKNSETKAREISVETGFID